MSAARRRAGGRLGLALALLLALGLAAVAADAAPDTQGLQPIPKAHRARHRSHRDIDRRAADGARAEARGVRGGQGIAAGRADGANHAAGRHLPVFVPGRRAVEARPRHGRRTAGGRRSAAGHRQERSARVDPGRHGPGRCSHRRHVPADRRREHDAGVPPGKFLRRYRRRARSEDDASFRARRCRLPSRAGNRTAPLAATPTSCRGCCSRCWSARWCSAASSGGHSVRPLPPRALAALAWLAGLTLALVALAALAGFAFSMLGGLSRGSGWASGPGGWGGLGGGLGRRLWGAAEVASVGVAAASAAVAPARAG